MHMDGARKARAELRESIDLMLKASPDVGTEHGDAYRALAAALNDYERLGVDPVIPLLEQGHYAEANALIIRQTNPTFNKLRAAVTKLSDAISQSAATQVAQLDASLARMPVIILGAASATLLLCGVIGFMVARSITGQIGGEPAVGTAMMRTAAGGDLTVETSAPTESMLGSMVGMLAGLRAMFIKLGANAQVLKTSSSDIKHSMREIARSAEKQAAATASVAAAVEELTVSINHIADSVRDTDLDATRAAEEAEEGRRSAAQVVDMMGRISAQLVDVSAQIRALDNRSHEIVGIASVIKDIADQTNLLALNAAIEAARAGDTGRGFAVVADEVRKLAERTADATGEIENLIHSFQTDTQAAVTVMERAMPQVTQGAELVGLSSGALERIHSNALAICARVREVVEATREQSATSTAIAQEIEQIAQGADESNSAAQVTMGAVTEVEKQAAQLETEVEKFRV
jgi:methyl-accepting chemotaxis protein